MLAKVSSCPRPCKGFPGACALRTSSPKSASAPRVSGQKSSSQSLKYSGLAGHGFNAYVSSSRRLMLRPGNAGDGSTATRRAASSLPNSKPGRRSAPSRDGLTKEVVEFFQLALHGARALQVPLAAASSLARGEQRNKGPAVDEFEDAGGNGLPSLRGQCHARDGAGRCSDATFRECCEPWVLRSACGGKARLLRRRQGGQGQTTHERQVAACSPRAAAPFFFLASSMRRRRSDLMSLIYYILCTYARQLFQHGGVHAFYLPRTGCILVCRCLRS